MTTHTTTLVKNSWTLVAQLDPETVGSLFYNRLFTIAPNVKEMFGRSPLPEQSRKLIAMLSYIISKLDKLDDILEEVAKLARRHTAYGVKDEHYQAVGTALLWTLEKGLDEHWNPELATAWTEVYSVLAEAMMTAQHETVTSELPTVSV